MYQTMIRESLARSGHVGQYDPRHIEAFMRVERNALDALSARQFAREVSIARQCVDEGGRDTAERIAKSFGF
mgnify:CR=1 FL=1